MMALLLPAGSSWLMGLQAAVFASLRLPYFKHDTYYNNEAGERSYLVSAACAILTCWLPKPDRATRRPADFLHILHRQAAEGVATITDTGLDGVMAPAPGSLIIETGKEKDRKHVSPASAAKGAAIRDAFVSAPAFRLDDVESDDEEALLREAVLDNAHVEDEDNAHVEDEDGEPPRVVAAVIAGGIDDPDDPDVPFGGRRLADLFNEAVRPPGGAAAADAPVEPPAEAAAAPPPLPEHTDPVTPTCARADLDAILRALLGLQALPDRLHGQPVVRSVMGAVAWSYADVRSFLERTAASVDKCLATATNPDGAQAAAAVDEQRPEAAALLDNLNDAMCEDAITPFTCLRKAVAAARDALAGGFAEAGRLALAAGGSGEVARDPTYVRLGLAIFTWVENGVEQAVVLRAGPLAFDSLERSRDDPGAGEELAAGEREVSSRLIATHILGGYAQLRSRPALAVVSEAGNISSHLISRASAVWSFPTVAGRHPRLPVHRANPMVGHVTPDALADVRAAFGRQLNFLAIDLHRRGRRYVLFAIRKSGRQPEDEVRGRERAGRARSGSAEEREREREREREKREREREEGRAHRAARVGQRHFLSLSLSLSLFTCPGSHSLTPLPPSLFSPVLLAARHDRPHQRLPHAGRGAAGNLPAPVWRAPGRGRAGLLRVRRRRAPCDGGGGPRPGGAPAPVAGGAGGTGRLWRHPRPLTGRRRPGRDPPCALRPAPARPGRRG